MKSLEKGTSRLVENSFVFRAFGTVYAAVYKKQKVAVKKLRNDVKITEAQKADFEKEIELMTKLGDHKNIVCVMGIMYAPEISIVMELMEEGSLQKYLEDTKNIKDSVKLDIVKGNLNIFSNRIRHCSRRGIFACSKHCASRLGNKKHFID